MCVYSIETAHLHLIILIKMHLHIDLNMCPFNSYHLLCTQSPFRVAITNKANLTLNLVIMLAK